MNIFRKSVSDVQPGNVTNIAFGPAAVNQSMQQLEHSLKLDATAAALLPATDAQPTIPAPLNNTAAAQ